MSNLPEKVIKQRLKLQLQSLDSPSDLPVGPFRSLSQMGVSPMTDLALNFHCSSLGMTPSPNMDTKRRLCLDSSSSDSTPSPNQLESSGASNDSPAPMMRVDSTPLSSITNKPTRKQLGFTSRLTTLKSSIRDMSESNKENLIPMSSPIFSPDKRISKVLKSPSYPCLVSSPAKEGHFVRRAKSLQGLQSEPQRKRSVKRPILCLSEEDSRDSGYNSQSLFNDQDDLHVDKRPRPTCDESLEQMLAGCSPGKEPLDGVTALPESPETKVVLEEEEDEDTDGFNVLSLSAVKEEEEKGLETEVPRPMHSLSFLDNKIILPSHIEGVSAFMAPSSDLPTDIQLLSSAHRAPTQQRPQFRRALSMMETTQRTSSPLSRSGNFGHVGKLSFKRPEPPRGGTSLLGVKKRRMGDYSSPSCSDNTEDSCPGQRKPVFCRSHSETELSIMKSCQLKEETPDILPDSSRLYALPSISAGSKHPSLRSITCHTMAEMMKGRYSSTIRSYRIVDVRYKFEYDGGHIKNAENWQHGEDEEFLNAFIPSEPLTKPPLSYDSATYDEESSKKRDILIFHCEFSSQRGPDFYMKLRERDRQLNKDVYPGLYFPECYLLHLGYKEFWRNYPSLCAGTYTEMIDPRHELDLRKMRAKSKSWSGGTVARTSRVGRLNL